MEEGPSDRPIPRALSGISTPRRHVHSVPSPPVRVVAGSAGGIPLEIPRTDIRPTMDRVRGAIFSSLGDLVPGASVLDLFAGSGALGIEALSRGAASAVFVESNPKCVASITRNLAKTRLAGDVRRLDVFKFLASAHPATPFDVIFADPPYCKRPDDRDFTAELFRAGNLRSLLAPDGILVLEQAPGARLQLPGGWGLLRQRKYGSTEVLFLRGNDRHAEGIS